MRPKDIQIEYSALSQKISAYSVRWASKCLAKQGVTNVAEVGCGRLRNLSVLREYFETVDLVETNNQIKKIRDLVPESNAVNLLSNEEFEKQNTKYDAIFLISVLHTLPYKIDRAKILQVCESNLNNGGILVLDVPQSETYYNRRRSTSRKFNDVWLIRHGDRYSFYKSYFRAELNNFVRDSTTLELVTPTFYSKHLISLWRCP